MFYVVGESSYAFDLSYPINQPLQLQLCERRWLDYTGEAIEPYLP